MAFPFPSRCASRSTRPRAAAAAGEVPVGAVVTRGGEVLGVGAQPDARPTTIRPPMPRWSRCARRRRALGDCAARRLRPLGDAGALRDVRRARSRWRGSRRLYFGAADPKGGAVLHGPRLFGQPTCHHAPEVYPGIGESEAGALLQGVLPGAARCLKRRPTNFAATNSSACANDPRHAAAPRTLSLARRPHHPAAGRAERRVRDVGAGDRLVAQAAAEGDGAGRAARRADRARPRLRSGPLPLHRADRHHPDRHPRRRLFGREPRRAGRPAPRLARHRPRTPRRRSASPW